MLWKRSWLLYSLTLSLLQWTVLQLRCRLCSISCTWLGCSACKPFKWCCMTPPSRGSAHGAYPLGILVLEPMKSQRIPVIVTNAYLKKRLFDITRQWYGIFLALGHSTIDFKVVARLLNNHSRKLLSLWPWVTRHIQYASWLSGPSLSSPLPP